MKNLTNLFKKLRLRQILTVFLAGITLFISTACNSGDIRGARPENPPVQMGGANNPHKGGGDGYTQYKMSTDPDVKSNTSKAERDRADLQIISNQLIAAANNSGLIYPSSDTNSNSAKTSLEDNQIPAESHTLIERIDQDNILERAGNVFNEATGFLQDKSDEAGERPELKTNPALQK